MPSPAGGGAPSLLQMLGPNQSIGASGAIQTQPEFGTWANPDYTTARIPLYDAGPNAGGWAAGGYEPGSGPFKPPPDLAKYFDATGEYKIQDPREVAADAGISLAQLAGGFMPRYGTLDFEGGPTQRGQGYEYPNDRGGFFRVEDLFRQTGTPSQASASGPGAGGFGGGPTAETFGRTGAIPVPQAATYGMSRPSTNNWRLIGRGPGYIMRNGFIINTQDVGGRQGGWAGWTPSSISGEQHTPGHNYGTPLGAGSPMGLPNVITNVPGMRGTFGWPGAEQWINFGGGTNEPGLAG
jgi:hypothetical protein